MELKAWIHAARLRTLPLSVSGILVGGSVAKYHGSFDWIIFILLLLTTLLLQILSNFANDYGDFTHGTDNNQRVGPTRAIQSGQISSKQMKLGITITSFLALISGLLMLYLSIGKGHLMVFMLFVIVGLLAILAALKYTIGHNPFGYKGLGDVMVFIFFGLVAVIGSCYLFTKSWNYHTLLPAFSIGFFSSGVLNINNLRDIDNDKKSGKSTLIVKMGSKNGRWYHLFLVVSGILSMLVFLITLELYLGVILLLLPMVLLLNHVIKIIKNKDPKALDPELKHLSLITLLLSLLTSVVLII